MKNIIFLIISVFLITSCIKDLPQNNPYQGTPIIETGEVSDLFPDSFNVAARILSTDEEQIVEKGFCWNTDSLPTILNKKTSITTQSNLWDDRFNSKITDFEQGTYYHIRAYVKTKFRVVYGNDVRFKTNGYGKGIKDIDGNFYKTVHIGEQEWMAENLKVSKFNNGSALKNLSDDNLWRNTTSSGYCYYNNEYVNDEKYGKLYNGYTISNNLNICPQGWRIPNKNDWEVLFNSTNLTEVSENGNYSARSLKADEKNPFYFSALDGGYRADYGSWIGFGFEGNWWFLYSNDIDLIKFSNRDSPESRGLIYYPISTVNHTGGSIRCIKN
jgi:uncharacterized protein (TIGR02145 family)